MNMKHILVSLAALLVLVTACGPKKESSKPAISGAAGEIIVVITKAQWEGEAGSAIREVLADAYPYLPQKEAMFNLVNVPESGVNHLLRTHRNMLYLKIADTCACELKVRRDVWSAPQTMLIVSAPDAIAAAEFIRTNREAVVNTFEKAERDRSVANAKLYEDKGVRMTVEDMFGGSPWFPQGYSIKKQAEDFIWISYETATTIQGILIYSYPYTGNYQFTPTALLGRGPRLRGDVASPAGRHPAPRLPVRRRPRRQRLQLPERRQRRLPLRLSRRCPGPQQPGLQAGHPRRPRGV